MSQCQEISCREAVSTYPRVSCVYRMQRHMINTSSLQTAKMEEW